MHFFTLRDSPLLAPVLEATANYCHSRGLNDSQVSVP